MDLNAMLKKYADLIVRSGINLQKDQILCIAASLESAELVRLVAESAYKAGAKEVCVRWNDETISRLRYDYAPMSQFENIPDWFAAYNNGYAREGAGFLQPRRFHRHRLQKARRLGKSRLRRLPGVL